MATFIGASFIEAPSALADLALKIASTASSKTRHLYTEASFASGYAQMRAPCYPRCIGDAMHADFAWRFSLAYPPEGLQSPRSPVLMHPMRTCSFAWVTTLSFRLRSRWPSSPCCACTH